MDIDAIMLGPRLKVKRAHHHIDLLREMVEPLWPGLYDLRLKRWTDPANGQVMQSELTYVPKEHLAEKLALVVGDAVHNLRSALDHLATGIIRTINPTANPYFPIHAERKNLEADRDLAAIEKALPGAKALFLEKIRPANGPEEKLWLFSRLNNDDKHSLIIPTVGLTKIMTGRIELPAVGFKIGRTEIGSDATREYILITGPGEITIEGELNVAASISFAKGSLFENEPVLPALAQFANLVEKTLNAFEKFMRRARV